jgi:hypothetical protein
VDDIRRGERPDGVAHLLLERALELRRVAILVLGADEHVGVDARALDVVGNPTTAASATASCGHERALDLRRAEPVAGHVQHVVDAPGDPVITVLVAPAAVAGEVIARLVLAEIGES